MPTQTRGASSTRSAPARQYPIRPIIALTFGRCQPEVAGYPPAQSGAHLTAPAEEQRIGSIAPGNRPRKQRRALAIDDNSIMVVSLALRAGKPAPGDNPILFERTQNDPDCTTALSRRFSRRSDHLRRPWGARSRGATPLHRFHDRRRLQRPLHSGQFLRAVRADRCRARTGDACGAGACRRPGAGHRDDDAFRLAHLRRAQPPGPGRGRGDGDDHAALSRRHVPRAGERRFSTSTAPCPTPSTSRS